MSEIRALLLTDVVDSTRLSEKIGDTAMAALWAAHDRVARDLLPAWRGREIDKTDGLLLLFASAADAVGYVLAYHRLLAALDVPLKARAGLHVGPVILRENSAADIALGAKPLDVEGIAKPFAARIMSTAQGGQTLLSAEARENLGETRMLLVSHGHWRMKGVSEPVELFEVGDIDSPFVPPADTDKVYRVVRQEELWLPLREVKHSLPAERDAFVGRKESLLELARRFDGDARLVSILGMGGSGKTRLVTRFGWTWLGEFPGGVWFCDLAQARSVDGIVHAVADALDVPLGKDDPVTQLGNAIAGRRRCLVILDNFEQVARHAEETLGRWLDRAGEARFVVTTREVLGLPGEETMALAPLSSSEAAALFIKRAASVKPDFQPGGEDQAAIMPLVKLLDCLPLAIELAAARVRVMPPRTLLARMGERFKLLSSTGGRRDRQATLRATFDWSWDLLSPPDKAALAQLSVFQGGFTIESAEAVLDLSGFEDAPWPTDTVQSLVDKSFVRQVADGRFDLLVSVQEYAAEHLQTEGRFAGSGPAALALAEARHSLYFAGYGEERAVASAGAELDNLVVACRRAAVAGAMDVAAAVLEGAWAALKLRGPLRVGVELAMIVESIAGLDGAARATVERVAGSALFATGKRAEARVYSEQALRSAREAGDRRCEAGALNDLGRLGANDGRMDEAWEQHEEALTLAREIEDGGIEWDAHNSLGAISEVQGRMDNAQTHFQTALTVARKLGDRLREGRTLGNLGIIDMEQGRMEGARTHYEAALATARETGDRRWEGNELSNLGLLHQVEGRQFEAEHRLEEALVLAREMGNVRLESYTLCNMGIVCGSLGRLGEARTHHEAALFLAREQRDRRLEGQVLGYLGLVRAREGNFAEARRCLEAGENILREVSDPFSLGILKCSSAETEYLAGAFEAAKAALVEVESMASTIGAGSKSELGVNLVRVRELFAFPPASR